MSDPKPVLLQQKHNFYGYYCDVIGSYAHYAGCLRRQRDIATGNTLLIERDCEMAVLGKKRGCTMTKLMKDELNGQGRYYVDREDAGLGVIGRHGLGLPPRTDEEKEYHRSLAAKLGWKIFEKNAEQIELERRYFEEKSTRRTIYISPAITGRRVDRQPMPEKTYADTTIQVPQRTSPKSQATLDTKDFINDEIAQLRNSA